MCSLTDSTAPLERDIDSGFRGCRKDKTTLAEAKIQALKFISNVIIFNFTWNNQHFKVK